MKFAPNVKTTNFQEVSQVALSLEECRDSEIKDVEYEPLYMPEGDGWKLKTITHSRYFEDDVELLLIYERGYPILNYT